MLLLEEAYLVLGTHCIREGITPLPEKLDSIQKMLLPKTPKEVKQFIGLIGYYRKFVPRFSDLAQPLNALTRKDVGLNGPQFVKNLLSS